MMAYMSLYANNNFGSDPFRQTHWYAFHYYDTKMQLKWWPSFSQAHHFNGLVQERSNSSALAMELYLSCKNPSIFSSLLQSRLSKLSHGRQEHALSQYRLSKFTFMEDKSVPISNMHYYDSWGASNSRRPLGKYYIICQYLMSKYGFLVLYFVWLT